MEIYITINYANLPQTSSNIIPPGPHRLIPASLDFKMLMFSHLHTMLVKMHGLIINTYDQYILSFRGRG